jgi:magnesium-transporting ATPase (P-type)
VLGELGSTPTGLSSTVASARLARDGPNVIATRRVTVFSVLLRQLRNPLLVLLVGAATVSALTGDVTDGVLILVIVTLSVGLGFVNEYRSEVAVAALHDSIHHDASVWRDGSLRSCDVRDLVVRPMRACSKSATSSATRPCSPASRYRPPSQPAPMPRTTRTRGHAMLRSWARS